MSTGNPFRRQQRLPDETTYHDAPTTILHSTTTPKVPKKKKRVVIQTPPHSPEELTSIPRRFSDGRTGSPPPALGQQLPLEEKDDETDSTTTADSDLERAAAVGTQWNFGGSVPATPPSSVVPAAGFGGQGGGPRAPHNPFARTLATSEAAFGLQADIGPTTGDERAQQSQQQRQGGAAGRPALLDVDAFKSILMTGSATPSPPTGSTSTGPQRPPQDSGSSTDTSSVSRHSIFDAMHDAHPESPRTSFDDHPEDSEGDGDDEHSSLMGPVSGRPVEEGPPAPPKTKHGRGFPQTVSFADFDESIPSAGTPPLRLQTPPVMASMMRPSTPRSPSDLNKPLPPPPAERIGGSNAVNLELPQKLASAFYQPSMTLQVESQSLAKKTMPPPPPVARRRGQAEPGQGRARSESNLSQSSAQQTELAPTSSSDQAIAKPAPPPPPSRRTQASANSHSPSPAVETPPSLPPPQSNLTAAGETEKFIPQPPPRRQPSKRGTSVIRTPSTASRVSLPRSDSFTGAAAAPPPAPPPRRGAKRNSGVDNRRTSGQSFGSVSASERSMDLRNGVREEEEPDGGGQGMEPVRFPAVAERPPQGDVLADLDAFQAEIEALRVRAAAGGG
ncbi:hypothetical protein B0A55_11094 [Friedmanniomyces simplex]|uniref:Uncharacterized protein n=1 Tax=Friedmanniomyces simplex TaxID=329884 RepID=A0A4U0WL57_9PEZI|nr:hypothetical protein B0A55_11094 [Friedmanniomyces simplex]